MLAILGKMVGWLGFLVSLFESPLVHMALAKAKALLLSLKDSLQAALAMGTVHAQGRTVAGASAS